MVESTDFGERHHVSFRPRLNTPGRGRVLLEGEMRSRPMIIGGIIGQNTPQMPFAEHDHMVKTFAPD